MMLPMTRIKKHVEELRQWAASWKSVDELAAYSRVNKRTLYRFRKTGEASLPVLDLLSSARERHEAGNDGKDAA